jgi:LysM repeat protein
MKKKKNKLLLNLIEGDKHKHRVAMVNEEAEWNQHEPTTGMGRMFFVMLMIHVVVIGGIIVYDWLNGEETPASLSVTSSSTTASALPPPALNAADIAAQIPIEECATYEWRSGDSIASVAKKLNVSEDMLIKMNMLDKGTQLEANSIIRYPKEPAVRAVGVGIAGVKGELPVIVPPTSPASLAAAEGPMSLTAPGEQVFSFQPTIVNELAPTPGTTSAALVTSSVQDSPPAAVTTEATGFPVTKVESTKPTVQDTPPAAPAIVKKDLPKIDEAPVTKTSVKKENVVPKAIPVKRYTPPVVTSKKKIEPATKGKTYTVKPNETLYSIATRNGVSVKALQEANKIAKPESLRDGMKIIIPGK